MARSIKSWPRVLLVAGEASGDLHGSRLLLALRERCPTVSSTGVGGYHLRNAGLEIIADVNQLSAAGLVEVLRSIPCHWRVMHQLKMEMDTNRPDVVILVDYPAFNQLVAKEANKRGIPTYFYIAPKVWAWGKRRARRMASFIDRMAVIFPFEEALFNCHGRSFAQYVGHPLLDSLRVSRQPLETRRVYGFSQEQPLLILMPGSRHSEVSLLLPDLLKTASLLQADGWQVALLRAPTIQEKFLERVTGGRLPITIIEGDTHNLLAAADCAVVASGTATLEAALLGCPPVIVYRFSWITYLLARLLIGRRVMGLPNILLGRKEFPELVQRCVKPEALRRAVLELKARESQSAEVLSELLSKIGPTGASDRAAELLLEMF